MIYEVLLEAVSLNSIKVLASSPEEAKRYAEEVCELTDAVKFQDDDVVEVHAAQVKVLSDEDNADITDVCIDGSEDAFSAMKANVAEAQTALDELSSLLRHF